MAIEFTIEQLDALWDGGSAERSEQQTRANYYEGDHPIIGQNETYPDGTKKSELVTNWIADIVDRYVGAITGTAWQVSRTDEEDSLEGVGAYATIAKDQNLPAVDAENLKNALLQNWGVEVHSFDEEVVITTYDPREWVMVRDSSDMLIAALRQITLEPNTVHNEEYLDDPLTLRTLYTDTEIISYRLEEKDNEKQEWVEEGRKAHHYGRVPVVQWRVNDQRKSIISAPLMKQNDEYNSIDSSSGDQIQQVVNAILKVWGYNEAWLKDNESMINQQRMLPLNGTKQESDAEFMSRENDVERVGARLERTRDAIHMMGEIPDVAEIVGSTGAPSGIALKLMFTPMAQSAAGMIPYLREGVRERIELINAMLSVQQKPPIENASVVIQFEIPVNQVEQWQNIGALQGIVSHRTQLELLSDVDDPERELLALEREQLKLLSPEQQADQIDAQAEQLKPQVADLVEGLSAAVTDFILREGIAERAIKRKQQAGPTDTTIQTEALAEESVAVVTEG